MTAPTLTVTNTSRSPNVDRRLAARGSPLRSGSREDCGTFAMSARLDARRAFPFIRPADDMAASCNRGSLSALRDRCTNRSLAHGALAHCRPASAAQLARTAATATAKPLAGSEKAGFPEENDDTDNRPNEWTNSDHWMFLRSGQTMRKRRSQFACEARPRTESRSLTRRECERQMNETRDSRCLGRRHRESPYRFTVFFKLEMAT